MDRIIEEAMSCFVSEEAGVAAAVSSARSGTKTLLVESQGCLGGAFKEAYICAPGSVSEG